MSATKRPRVTHAQPLSTSKRHTFTGHELPPMLIDLDDSPSEKSDESDEESTIVLRRQRKAENQRRYYNRNKASEQMKARDRAANLAKTRAAVKKTASHAMGPTIEFIWKPVNCTNVAPHPPAQALHSTPSILASSQTLPSFFAVADSSSSVSAPFVKPACLNVPAPPAMPYCEDWPTWSARQRMAAIRRLHVDVEWRWGSIDEWPLVFSAEAGLLRHMGIDGAWEWMREQNGKVAAGRLLLGYIGRVMEGNMPEETEDWRDIFLQSYQLMYSLAPGVVGKERALRALKLELNTYADTFLLL